MKFPELTVTERIEVLVARKESPTALAVGKALFILGRAKRQPGQFGIYPWGVRGLSVETRETVWYIDELGSLVEFPQPKRWDNPYGLEYYLTSGGHHV
jgi:hypothetical protein